MKHKPSTSILSLQSQPVPAMDAVRGALLSHSLNLSDVALWKQGLLPMSFWTGRGYLAKM